MRARMAIGVSNQRCELREVVLRDKPAAMLEVSPKETVPVLVLSDQTILDESLQIMYWALAQNDPEGWLSSNKNEGHDLISVNDGPFKYHLDRYKYASRYEGVTPQENRTACEEFLLSLKSTIANQSFLFGAAPTFADIAIFPFIRQFRIADTDWFDNSPHQEVRAWLERCLSLPVFQLVMTKYDQWKEGDAPVYFPALS